MNRASEWEQRFNQPPHLLGTLFWLHGTETVEELRRTFDLAVRSGIGELTLESRPHWDYLGPRWWSDVKRLLSWSREAGIGVYLFDEKWYPSGVAGNTIQKLDPAFRRSSIRLQYIRYRGPLARIGLMPPWTDIHSAIIGLYAYPVADGIIRFDQAADLTGRLLRPDSPHMHGVVHGVHWDVPKGDWIVCFIVEDRSDNYIDPLHPGAVDAFIDRVYESSKTELGTYFGSPVKGFFFDEPAYFNDYREVPWGYDLRNRFIRAKGYDPLPYLPALWLLKESPASAFFAYDYYDFLHKEYANTYCRRIYEWCRKHGLKYIGHWYEHEAVPRHGERYMFHERTTEGPGDFFEVSRFADEGGIDLVCNQVIPGQRNRDYWGLPKLGSSAAHIFGLKDDIAMSETFGAYGWHLGLRMMKWLTDWQAVRGINHFILHAFNPQWPDLDCPPYFYDGGLNPQWPYFEAYVRYVNRLSWIFREGRHVASLLLLYPGALGYAGTSTPIEDVQQVLQENQYDYDLIPVRELMDKVRTEDGVLELGKETYRGVVVPGMDTLTAALCDRLAKLAESGIPVILADRRPSCILDLSQHEAKGRLSALIGASNVVCTGDPAGLRKALEESGIPKQLDFAGGGGDGLRVLHRIRDERDIWMVSNESVEAAADGWIRLQPGCRSQVEAIAAWDPLTGDHWKPELRRQASQTGQTEFRLYLPPYRSLVLTATDLLANGSGSVPAAYTPVQADSEIVRIDPGQIEFDWQGGIRHGLPSWLTLDPGFSGTVSYRWRVDWPHDHSVKSGRVMLDLGKVEEIAEVWVNGEKVGDSFVPPYRFDTTAALRAGENRFEVKVTNVVSNRMSRAAELEDLTPNWRRQREIHAIPEDGGLLGPVKLLLG